MASKLGRPSKANTIDVEQLERCAEKQWSVSEIAAFFRVSDKTIARHYSENIRAARQRGRTKIRDLQWKRALEGSDVMIKHLSEHYLDQHAQSHTEITGMSLQATTINSEQTIALIQQALTLPKGEENK